MNRLAIISTHPIQYNAPLFALLSKKVRLKVFYTWSQKQTDLYDQDFKTKIEWDIPLLEGYDYKFVENIARNPEAHHYWGIKCPSLNKEIKAWGATHLLVFGWNYHAHLRAMWYFKGKIPVWFRGDSTLLDEKRGLKIILRRLILKLVYQYVDKAFYVGQNNKNYFLKHGLTESQLIFAPHAIDIERFGNNHAINYEALAKQWKFELGINESDFVILYCGKFESKKNPLLLLATFLNIKRDQTNSHLKLIFTGGGILERKLKLLANNHKDVIFLPFQNQSKMPIVYRLAKVFCLPSQGPGETWGLAVNEAMASGRPVLVSDKVGCAVDLINENSGCIFKSGDKRSLFDTLDSIIERETKPDGYNSNVIRSHISKWSYNSIINQIVSQLNE